ncbi:hypothetical protein LOTGIDRAFT_201270 [Lottia gigantea]|uniref:Cytochrome P450 n=1 Tax=Lottia gigantea TaxID=225164 RepID=V4AWZ7_LOTGI|nr:hypothetical protein LOTGIDRAFT_201270 [Lottia gigantea]ESO99585.1 hypothetical protein LOTGIDRAFT_201270 [Lottia gigantea]
MMASSIIDTSVFHNLKIDLDAINNKTNLKAALLFGSSFLGLYWLYGKFSRRHIKDPPGPFSFPIVGNMPQLAGSIDLYQLFLQYREQYGDVIKFEIGSTKMIVICGYKAIHECLIEKGHCFANRPNWIYIIDQIFHNSGVFWTNGQRWKDLRRFTLTTLRDFGVGKKSLEERILDEFTYICNIIDSKKGHAFNPKFIFANGVANIICTIVFGERFEYDDPEFLRMIDMLNYLFKNVGFQVPENFFPIVRMIRGNSSVIKNDVEIQKFVKKRIEEHRQTFDPNELRDFIDMYLKVCQDKSEDLKVNETDMFRITVDLFLAGSETTATSLWWTVLYLINYPDIQNKCYQEIMKLTGGGRNVTLADKPHLVYIWAFLNEVLRIVCITPTTPPRAVSEECTINGYTLEKDTMVLFHINSAHFDTDFWDEPEKFNPDRWIGNDGKIIKHKAFMPFGGGTRSCMGEPLANMELFIFACNFISRYEFKVPDGQKTPSIKGTVTGVTMQPDPYEVIAVPR